MYAGMAKGASNAMDYISKSEDREIARQRASLMQQKQQAEFDEWQGQQPNRDQKTQIELETLRQKNHEMQIKGLEMDTFSAFDRFKADNNVRHLNTWLQSAKQNEAGAKIYGDTNSFSSLAKSPENDRLLKQAGYANPDDVYDDPDEVASFLIVTDGEGNKNLIETETLYAQTKYDQHLTDEELERQMKVAQKKKLIKEGNSLSAVMQKEKVIESIMAEKGISYSEAYKALEEMDAKNSGRGYMSSTEERAVAAIMDEQNIGYSAALGVYYQTKGQYKGGRQSNQQAYIDNYMEENPKATHDDALKAYAKAAAAPTKTQKQAPDIEMHRTALDEMDWLNMDMSKMSSMERGRIYSRHIGPLEQLTSFKMTGEERKTIRRLRDLTALGEQAGSKMTAAATGLLDSMLVKTKKYISNEVGELEATSAYESFRNIFRNALYGASLTKPEIQSFQAAAGSLGQKFGPVMQQLKTQMMTIQTNLQAIAELQDPYIAKFYTGQSIEEIEDAIDGIQERLDDKSLWQNPDGNPDKTIKSSDLEASKQAATPEQKQSAGDNLRAKLKAANF